MSLVPLTAISTIRSNAVWFRAYSRCSGAKDVTVMSETTELSRATAPTADAEPRRVVTATYDVDDNDTRGRPEMVIMIAVVASVSLIFGFVLGLLF